MVKTDPIFLNDWHVVAAVEECQPGTIKKARLLGEDLLLWRSNEPDAPIHAWQDRCPHRGARLSIGELCNNTIVCPYHGWAFGEEGKCVNIPAIPDQTPPASAKVKTYHCQERYGFVWVCLGEPTVDISPFPEWYNENYRKFLCGPYPFHSSGPRVVENAVDPWHFPFVHEGGLGDRSQIMTVDGDYQVERAEDGVTSRNIRFWQPSDGTPISGISEIVLQKICRPLTVYTVLNLPTGQKTFFYTVTPVEEEESIVWMWVAANFGHDLPLSDLLTFQDRLAKEDADVVESQRPIRLPLSLHSSPDDEFPAEVNTRGDQNTVAYRRWLKEIGVTFGVC